MHRENIRNMYSAVESELGFDVVIVVSPSKEQAEFWQERLESARGSVIGRKTQVISVEEDWWGGAGQLLGTLYAWNKALSAADLEQILQSGGAVAMYHTAGKGTRMAPLPAAESNNKSAVKLPRLIETNSTKSALTILEAVIFQTGIFAASRGGRLCVFWGDQVFIPSKPVEFDGNHHAEILDMRAEMPGDKASWERDWHSYGLVIPVRDRGGEPHLDVLQREKQSWQGVCNMIEQGIVQPDNSGTVLAKSLGCFSLSYKILLALGKEFAEEIKAKNAKLDTDPHLWMPLTSSREEFVAGGKSEQLWERINAFKERFLSSVQQGLKLFGDKDVGAETLWWDYGQVRLYHENSLKLLEESYEGQCMREFYDLDRFRVKEQKENNLVVENSIVLNSQVSGKIKDSVLVGIRADEVDVSGCTIINSSLSRAQAERGLIYNCVATTAMEVSPNGVMADVFLPNSGRIRMKTELERDGKEDWETVLPGNPISFDKLNKLVESEDLRRIPAEQEKWINYYENRDMLQRFIEKAKRGFIKPDIDNLVEVVWGGDNIERLKQLPALGKNIGESWECSTHPLHPSPITLDDGSRIPLNNLLNLMGDQITGNIHRSSLPLVKFIDAREDLSVQVHPSDEKAKEVGENDTGKNEAWVILHAEEGAVMYLGFKEDVDRDEFERALPSGDTNIAERFLNAIPVKSGDVLFNPTGTAHAIGKGIFLAEIQQPSGLTYRLWDWNRVPQRTLHIAKAMESLNFKKSTKEDFELTSSQLSKNEERLIDSLYFTFDRLTLKSGQELSAETGGVSQILTCLSGEVELTSDDSTERLSQGESLLVPASVGNYQIKAQKESVLLKSFTLTSQHIDPVIFQTYDVRAIADKYLTDRVCYYLGKGYGTFLRRNIAPNVHSMSLRGSTPQAYDEAISPPPPRSLRFARDDAEAGGLWVAVGGGIRLSTARVRRQVINGLLSTGVNVYDVGTTSTPEMYFSVAYLDADGGINVTASHNESEYNGLKQVIRSEDGFITSINADQMIEIKQVILSGDFIHGKGEYREIEGGEVANYHNELVKANCRLGRDIWIYLLRKWSDRGLNPLLDTIAQLDFPETLDDTKWSEIKQALDIPYDFEQPPTAIKYPLQALKAVIDFGNGSAWRTKAVYSDLGAKVVAINETPDGSFPSHIPNPIKAKYRKELEDKVKEVASQELAVDSPKEVVAIGHDEDGDRVIYVRADGQVVEGDRTLAMQAKHMIEEHFRKGHPGRPRFMGEVKFSRVAEEFITSQSGEYIMSPTGFAFIKDGVKTLTRALRDGLPEAKLSGGTVDLRGNKQPVALAAELSGHQMSGHEENWIFDDGTFAAVKVLTAIANGLKEGKTFIDLDEEIPRYPASPEINIKLSTNILSEKQEVVEAVIEIFQAKGYPIDTIDGGLIKWVDSEGSWLGQALVRMSNTQPMLICRTEGKDEETKARIEEEFFNALTGISTSAVSKLDLTSDDYTREFLQSK